MTDDTLRRRQTQKASLDRSIENSTLECDDGSAIPLADAVQSSTANPANRRNELMVRARGLEEIANELRHKAVFFTLTAPSKYHVQLASGGRNPKYDGSSVTDTMQWLNRKWQRTRTCLGRKGILYYGMRVTEPHHDATPHFHLLVFCSADDRNTIESVIRKYWLQDHGDEAGAQDRRVTASDIDPEKGSAVGYLAKYIAKNIDGFKVGIDLEGGADAVLTSERVEAWASTHRIRRFAQFGGPVTTLWREFRRLRSEIKSPAFEQVRRAACDNDYAAFVTHLGGIGKGRKVEGKIWKEHTGEINQYDEIRPPQVVGIELLSLRVRTRDRIYKLRWHSKLIPSASSFLTWTRSNNCTRPLTQLNSP